MVRPERHCLAVEVDVGPQQATHLGWTTAREQMRRDQGVQVADRLVVLVVVRVTSGYAVRLGRFEQQRRLVHLQPPRFLRTASRLPIVPGGDGIGAEREL